MSKTAQLEEKRRNIETEEPVRVLETAPDPGEEELEEPASPKPDTEAKTTSYIVLKAGPPDVGTWALDSILDAANAEAAIRLACKTIDNPAGTYVAIPARSWKPIVVKTEVQTLLKLEDAR